MVVAVVMSFVVSVLGGAHVRLAMYVCIVIGVIVVAGVIKSRHRVPNRDVVESGTNTDCDGQLSVEQGPVTVIVEPMSLLPSPVRKSSLSDKAYSPLAATTPSEQSHWVADDQDWFYLDLQGSQQGPFGSEVMRHWYESGFLSDSLLVSRDIHLPFRTISAFKTERGSIPFA